jgi:hypothetical protein
MRVSDILTITNNYDKKVCYWIFKTNDTVYKVSWDGQWGWLDPRQSVTRDMASRFKIGFRHDDSMFGDWYAEPEEANPNQPIALSEEAKIVKLEGFPNPDQSPTVNFMQQWQDDMHNMARTAILAGLGKIPSVGEGIAKVVEFIWPEKKESVEDLIAASESRMKAWVHGQIADYDRSFLTNKLAGLGKNVKAFLTAESHGERKRWLDNCLAMFNDAQGFYVKKNYTPGTLALVFNVANMHLFLLRERVIHNREIFGKDESLDAFKKELKETIDVYQKFVEQIGIPGEMKWREKMMEISETGPDGLNRANSTVRDHATREVHSFGRGINPGQGGDQTVLLRFYKAQALNGYRNALEINVGDPARLWSLLDPDQANSKPIPLDRVVWVGPCTGVTSKAHNEHGATDEGFHEDRPGFIKKMIVREWNEVDYLRFIYESHEGNGAGNPKGGEEHQVAVENGVFVNRIESWWDWNLSGIKFDFTNGKTTGKLGSRTGMGPHYQVASYPMHRLSAVRMYGHQGEICAVSFGFSPLPNYYQVNE